MNARDILARSPLFHALEAAALDRLAACCSLVSIAGGEALYAPGEPADAMYVVVTGRLTAQLRGEAAPLQIGRLESVGELSVVSGEQRGAWVHALRDSLLLRIGRDDLLAFVQAHPPALLSITREIIARLRAPRGGAKGRASRRHRTFAVIAAHPGIDVAGFAEQLRDALQSMHHAHCITAAEVDAQLGPGSAQIDSLHGEDNGRVVAWLNALESDLGEGYLVYAGSRQRDAWSRRCIRQADRVLVVAAAGDPPMLSPMIDEVRRLSNDTPVDFVMLRASPASSSDVVAWRRRLESQAHYFVRPGAAADYAALARQLAGRGVGLVLGGGGARGFAHLGLLRALETLNIPIDIAGGSSMGAFLAALHACGMDQAAVHEIARATFVDHNYLNDYLLPRVSLIRGRKLLTRLRAVFGTRRIEDLPKPYFCITTNLTRGIAAVHDTGDLALWVGTSMAIPGIAPPVAWHGDLHADGAVVNSLPTDVMQALDRGPIVASDVSTEGAIAAPGIEGPEPEALLRHRELESRVSLIDILFRTATLTSESGVRARAERADCYLRMPVSGIGLFDWKRLDEISNSSYDYAMRCLEPMREMLLGRVEPTPAAPIDTP